LASPVPASDRRGTIALTVAIAVGIAAAGTILWWRTRSASEAGATGAVDRPSAAEPASTARRAESVRDGAGERNRMLSRQPASPPTHEVGAKAYAAAVAAGEKNPGEKALRADALTFFEFNGDLAEEKAAREGITTDELKELTFLGLVAMQLQRWDDVARVTKREITADERKRGDELIFGASKEFKVAIREQVARGASVEARWETIRKAQASFVERYRELLKISPEEYDQLLAAPFAPAN
jgi:hypothetical protein